MEFETISKTLTVATCNHPGFKLQSSTADAELKAVFSTGATQGISGTIDKFDLEGQSGDPNWSVELGRLGFGTTELVNREGNDDTVHTLWSVNKNSDGIKIDDSSRAGDWNVQLLDDTTDKTNIPTTAIGTFRSHFATQGKMEGAFGTHSK